MTDNKSTEDTTSTDEKMDFAVTLAQLGKGKTNQRLSDELRDVVAAVTKTGKAGKVTLTVNVKPQKSVPGAVIVTEASKATAPVFDQQGAIFYATDDGDLVRDDPRQHALY
ncbi:hypothetical protein [Amycolatopsis sp. NPDC001319]|uniref:hypothetical protein n=1 Tax=unclassified Amycolatopsis TaxID=2618356 RepID=UPI00369A511E